MTLATQILLMGLIILSHTIWQMAQEDLENPGSLNLQQVIVWRWQLSSSMFFIFGSFFVRLVD